MSTTTTLTDDEWDDVQDDLRSHLPAFRDAYEGTPNRGQEVREETEEYVIFADASGQEISEIADAVGVDYDALYARMHEEARARYDGDCVGDAWSVADPVVVLKE